MWIELLSKLRTLALYYQTAHWSVKTSLFYQDHLLFERLYNTVNEEIDGLAERAVGTEGVESVNLLESLALISKAASSLNYEAGQNSAYFQSALGLEQNLLAFLEMVDKNEKLTVGTKNLFGGIADQHESHVYQLKQRLTQ